MARQHAITVRMPEHQQERVDERHVLIVADVRAAGNVKRGASAYNMRVRAPSAQSNGCVPDKAIPAASLPRWRVTRK